MRTVFCILAVCDECEVLCILHIHGRWSKGGGRGVWRLKYGQNEQLW